ncbi:hypothetical protein C9374_004590 [Naegleria lovaniensis]|uniref:Dymeclin n=1 Tax=Naegleria lovaniensis TaxID=51637 RepID=A0AA88KKP6_NAELO|nr:uncharacterized protein C9374_004590 [Naegleria lovaniensis]KAG2383253.1 hypothetical protein C9374_004590 [Naegleria lovaniensis]
MGSSDSKLQFKTMFSKLGENYIKHNDHNFWKMLFIQPLSIDDIFTVISPDDIRSLRKVQPANLGTIIYKCIEQLFLFSQPKNFFSESTSAKNSLHLLTRILPFVFEHDDDGFVSDLFFNNVLPGSANLLSVVGGATSSNQQVIEQEETSTNNTEQASSTEEPATTTTASDQKTETQTQQSTSVSSEQIEQVKQEIDQLKQKVEEKLENNNSNTPSEPAKKDEPPVEPVKEAPKVEEPKETPKPVAESSSGKKKKKKNKKKKGVKEEEKTVETSVSSTVAESNAEEQSETNEDASTEVTLSESPATVGDEQSTISQQEPQQIVEQEEKIEEQPVEQTQAVSAETTNNEASVSDEKKPLPILKIADMNLTSSLAEVMLQTLMRCLFLPDFTVPLGQFNEDNYISLKSDSLDENVLWQVGMGVPLTKGLRSASWEQMENRNDILRCLLTCFSSVLYRDAETCSEYDNKFLSLAVSDRMPHVHNLVYSLLNFVTAYDPRGSLPYSSQLFTDHYTQYIETSLHVLSVLLQHKPKGYANVYHTFFQQFRHTLDMTHLYSKMTLLLRNVVDSHNTYLPSSQKLIEFYEEVLLLLWLILGEAPIFRTFVCKELNITELLIPLLFIIQLHCKQVTKFPIVQLAAFTILLLSGNREFGVALNHPYKISTPLDVPVFEGNFADLLILFFNKIMVSDKGIIRGLYDCMLTIIANISPYTKSLSMLSSVKLLNLFEAFASPRFLYSSEKNHQFVALLLEVFNNIIQYQYEGNVHVIYSILRRGKLFKDLTQDPDLEPIKAAIMKKHEGKQGAEQPFIPTHEWVQSWRPKLPLYTITTLIDTLTPDVEKICSQEYALKRMLLCISKTQLLLVYCQCLIPS